ncbi:hypothetical protein H5410_021826 [Solanum commersonii]|uniref:Uncharacterized protein n=1 Tax=Solanum commersonii TaxID=4109 RepID=A0A9J5ZCG4_SOLCO|nr:hypothetical protein H5410_021826 [Solanum commersonii]
MLTNSLVHQSSSLGFTTTLSRKPKTHGFKSCYKPRMKNPRHLTPNLEDETLFFFKSPKPFQT